MDVKHACYAHTWDASRSRLFVCGGPLAFGLQVSSGQEGQGWCGFLTVLMEAIAAVAAQDGEVSVCVCLLTFSAHVPWWPAGPVYGRLALNRLRLHV